MSGSELPRVVLTGDIDVYTAAEACRPLHGLDGPAVIDLAEVTLLSAAGLSELAAVLRRVGPGRVVLYRPRPHVRRVLEIVGFQNGFLIVDESGPAGADVRG